MSHVKLNKAKLGIMLAMSLSAATLSGCSIAERQTQNYAIVLEDMSGYDDTKVANYLNGIPFSSENFRESVYNYLVNDPLKDTHIVRSPSEETVLDLTGLTDATDFRLYTSLKSLTIRNSNISDYSSLSSIKLNRIEFHDMDIDASLLSNLNVSSIDFINCNLTNLDKLPSNTEYLGISYCHGGSIECIRNMKKLKGMNLNNADVEGYEALADTKLQSLNINDCHLQDWSFLNQMTSLKELDVSFTNFNDVNLISNLTKLENLLMAYDNIKTLDGIEALNNLESISIESCTELDSYDNLVNLPKLKYADLANLEMIYDPSVVLELQNRGVTGFDTSDDLNIQNQVNAIYESCHITDDMSDEEKIRRICLKVQDVVEIPDQFDSEDIYDFSRNILQSGLKGYGVCNTFSGLTKALFDKAGIPNHVIIGECIKDNSDYLHVWNVVYVNGEWCGIDNTFMEQVDDAYSNIENGKDSIYYIDGLDDPVWQEYHNPYWVPDDVYTPSINLAK